MTPKLRIHHIRFSEAELRAWKGDYALVKDCPKPLKTILREKARNRPGRRFFGEAKVAAASLPYDEGWYGSFKWLTSSRWCREQTPMEGYQQKFRDALLRHFPNLCEFQHIVADAMNLLGRLRRGVSIHQNVMTM